MIIDRYELIFDQLRFVEIYLIVSKCSIANKYFNNESLQSSNGGDSSTSKKEIV